MKKLTVLLIWPFAVLSVNAQYVIATGGGNSLGTGGSASYSIGQMFYSNNEGSNGILSEGVQQPFEVSIITGNKENDVNLEVIAYPNPTTDFLILKVVNYANKDLVCRLFDSKGNLLRNHKLVDDNHVINMKDLATSTYYLKVLDINEEVVKFFRIVKN